MLDRDHGIILSDNQCSRNGRSYLQRIVNDICLAMIWLWHMMRNLISRKP